LLVKRELGFGFVIFVLIETIKWFSGDPHGWPFLNLHLGYKNRST